MGALENKKSNGRYGTDIGVAVRLPTRHPIPGGLHQEQVSARDYLAKGYIFISSRTRFVWRQTVPSVHVSVAASLVAKYPDSTSLSPP